MKLYMFRTVPLSIIRSSFALHSAMVYVIQVCRQLTSRTRMELQFHPGPARKLSTNLYDIYHCWVYSEWTPDDGQRHCPKHLEFHAKNKFAKLVHLVGLIIKTFVTKHGHMNVKFWIPYILTFYALYVTTLKKKLHNIGLMMAVMAETVSR